jgi:hypothetical protein
MHHELRNDNVRVVLDDDCNEGWFGNYDPTDNEDEPLLRFTVQRRDPGERDSWSDVDDASYCTGLNVDAPQEEIDQALQLILWAVGDAVRAGISIKKACERLSWVGAHADERRMNTESLQGE